MISTNAAVADAPYKVLYDADCELCRNSLSLLKSLDSRGLTEGVPLSDAALEEMKLPATMDECFAQMHVVSASGQLFIGYFAILRLAKLFPKTRPLAWLAEHLLPVSLGQRLYRLVANNRYRFNKCDSGTCKLK